MNSATYECYKKAGAIAKKVKDFARGLIEIDRPILEIADKIESKIVQYGGGLAFPTNISINNIAAHYTPFKNDTIVLHAEDVVKIDIGVHVNGYIADTAFTVYLGNNIMQERLVRASEEALQRAIECVKPGVRVNEIGKQIEKAIVEYGFKPIRNLTGHSLDQWNLHSGVTIPNVHQNVGVPLSEGDVVAIEPFATDGYGSIRDSDFGSIYKLVKERPTRFLQAKQMIEFISKSYKTLPFAKRWVERDLKIEKMDYFFKLLTSQGILHLFKAFVEQQNGLVSQAEDTVIVTSDGAEVTTS